MPFDLGIVRLSRHHVPVSDTSVRFPVNGIATFQLLGHAGSARNGQNGCVSGGVRHAVVVDRTRESAMRVLVLAGLVVLSGCGGGGTTGTNYSDPPPMAEIVATPSPKATGNTTEASAEADVAPVTNDAEQATETPPDNVAAAGNTN
jgi:hypothetical protein